MAAARRFFSSQQGPVGARMALQNQDQPPYASELQEVQPTDIVYPPPGGGLLRVPAGGGSAAEMFGTINGQLAFYRQADGAWVPTATGPTTGFIPRWDGATNQWVFVPAPNLGAVEYLDNSLAPVGLWQFNNSLADLSGNANDLILAAGNQAFTDIVPGKLGLFVVDGARYQNGVNAPPALLLPGAMTIEAVIQRDSPYTDNYFVAAFGGNGAAATENIQYALALPGSATTALQRIQMQWEQGGGVPVVGASSGDRSLPPIHNLIYIACRRSAGGVVRFYLNGLPFGPDTGALTLPTGGAGATRFIVGTVVPTGGSTTRFVLMSLRVSNFEKTDDQIKAAYNQSLGPAFGILP